MNVELESLCRQLAEFKFPQCGMLHERVQRTSGGEIPVRDSSVEHGYLRSEYCSSAKRRKRPGCAHTMARFDFESILNALPRPLFDKKKISNWKRTLQELDQLIIQVDWQKSDAELLHAKQCDALHQLDDDNGMVRQQIENPNGQILDLIDSHSKYVVRLRNLRDEVLAAVGSVQRVQKERKRKNTEPE